MSVFAELKRRNVFRVAALYVIAAWLIMQVAGLLFGVLEMPPWTSKLVLSLLALGFPLVLLFSWIYEITPEGLKKQHEVDRAASITHETGAKINVAIGVLAVLAILLIVADRLMPDRGLVGASDSSEARTDQVASDATSSVPAASDRSIAVLPFVDMSAGKDQEYFTDGISEELLNLLAKVPELKVIGRTSSFQFKGKNEDLRVIGQKLNVAHLLEGSVRKSGNKIRLTAQLIRADDGSHLWSETYDRTLDDIFAVQDEIASEVVRALKVTLLGDALPTPSRTEDNEAHTLYLQGRYFADRRGPGDHKKAIAYFEQALERDPNFAMAWVELSAARTNNANTMGVDMEAELRKARDEARRAVEVDPQLADGYASMAFDSMTLDWDWQEASRLLARARELDPNNLRTLRMTAHLAGSLGRLDEAVRLHQQVIAREPLVTSHHVNAALVMRNAGKLTEAEHALRKALELSPDAGGVY